MMVGRQGRSHLSATRKAEIGAPVLASPACRTRPVRRHRLRAAQRRDPRLLRPCRRRRSEVMQAISGITRTTAAPSVAGRQAHRAEIGGDSIDAGIVYVPEERGKQGVVIGLPIFQNISLPSLKRTSNQVCCSWRKNSRWPVPHRAARPARRLAQPRCRHTVQRQPAEDRHRQWLATTPR